jgi:hypothetical protein
MAGPPCVAAAQGAWGRSPLARPLAHPGRAETQKPRLPWSRADGVLGSEGLSRRAVAPDYERHDSVKRELKPATRSLAGGRLHFTGCPDRHSPETGNQAIRITTQLRSALASIENVRTTIRRLAGIVPIAPSVPVGT